MSGKDHPRVFNDGDRFRGYKVERLLGNGGLGAVYLVKHEILEKRFALKILYPEVAVANENYVKRFLREAKIATRIRHPNLVAVHDAGFDEERGLYYLVMDYVCGGDLRQAIAFAGHFDQDRAVEVIMQVASALEAAQTFKVVHRDLKPENIMIQPDGLVKLVDLGIAKSDDIKDSLNTTLESVFGTPAYVAPEQAVDASKVDARADIYSLGATIYHLAAGRVMFPGLGSEETMRAHCDNARQAPDPVVFHHLSEGFRQLLEAMLVKDRDYRIRDWAAVFDMCREVEAGAAFKPREDPHPSSMHLQT